MILFQARSCDRDCLPSEFSKDISLMHEVADSCTFLRVMCVNFCVGDYEPVAGPGMET